MLNKVYVFDPTASDQQSKVRGIGRYLQILKESFDNWIFTDNLKRIYTDSAFINPFYNFLQPPLLMRRVASKQIAVIHDLIPLKYPEHFPAGIRGNINIFLNKLALKNYDIIVTDSETSKKDIVKILKIDENKVKVIYPCLPKIFKSYGLRVMSYEEKNTQKPPNTYLLTPNYCLYVGDATWNKNLVNLAKAIKIINVSCVFVGKVFEILKPASTQRGERVQDDEVVDGASDEALREADCRDNRQSLAEEKYHERPNLPKATHPWQKEFNQFLNETKNDKRFIFAGFLPDQELIKLYQQTKVNILVSRDEGFGFSFLEAASQACPTVLANIPVLKEIAGSSYHCFAEPNDPNEIANKVGELYFNNDLRNKIGFEAHQRAKYFSSNNFKKGWLKIIS